MDPTLIALPLLAARVAARASQPSWILVVVHDDAAVGRTVNDLADELEVLVPEGDLARGTAPVEDALRLAGQKLVVVGVDESEAPTLDLARSRLQHPVPVVLVATASAAALLGPHLRSWIGGSIFQLEAEVSSTEDRLADLRRAYGKTDAEVIALAESRTTPLEPHFAEWLVLLNRGDLIPSGGSG